LRTDEKWHPKNHNRKNQAPHRQFHAILLQFTAKEAQIYPQLARQRQDCYFLKAQNGIAGRVELRCNPRLAFRRTSGGRRIRVASAETNAIAPDLALVTAIRSGDQGAMAALYDRFSSIVYAVALRVLQDTGAAEDVLQDIFMQLWRNPGAFDSSRGNMAAWLAVIARNRAIDALRKRRPQDDIEDVIVSVESDLASEADRSRAMAKVRGALQAMPSPQRSALEMAYFEGLTHTEIAQKTGEPLGTVKTRIRTGLLSLRKILIA
jgi:RNA polymerase sigma-70 factor, ECF subfamily